MNLRRDVAVATLFIALATAMTWPLALHLSNAGGDDPLTSTWALEWDYHATTHGLNLFDANMFAPARHSLAFGEHLFGVALFAFPLFAAGVAPLTIHNFLLLVGFAACGFTMYLLARHATASTEAAIIAGIAYAFVGIRFHHLPHLHLVWTMWFPLLLLASVRIVEAPTLGRSVWLAALLILNGLTSLHWFAFGTFTALVTVVVFGLKSDRRRESRFWLLAVLSFGVAAAVLAPFLVPYAEVARLYGMRRDYADVIANGARWRDWLEPNLQSKLYGGLSSADAYGHERTLFPGFITLALAALALFGDVRRAPVNDWLIAGGALATSVAAVAGRGVALCAVATIAMVAWRLIAHRIVWQRNPFSDRMFAAAVLWLVIGAWGARGLYGALHTVLFKYTIVFRGMRMPARWILVAYVGLDLLVAIGMKQILDARPRATRAVLTALVATALLFELRAAPIRFFLMPEEPRPVYSWLSTVQLHGGVLELPMTQMNAYTYVWRSTIHHQLLINGVTSYIPPYYERLQAAYDTAEIDDTFLNQLEELQCSLLVVHGEELGVKSEAVRAWLKKNVAAGKLAFVRRFDARSRGDYVFALTRSEPDSRRWREPERADVSGLTPLQKTKQFLDGQWTFIGEPFASVDVGPPIGTARGALTISGWALAPSGVRAVNMRFGNGRYVIAAAPHARPDVNSLLPWYRHDPLAGFHAMLTRPPASIAGDTDLQIEIIDANGRRVRMTPFWFRWLPSQAARVVWNEAETASLLERLAADTPLNRERLFSGSAAIHDFTPVLLRDSETETDVSFANRIVHTILGGDDRNLTDRLLEMLAEGTSRERAINVVLRSHEFHEKYVRQGTIVID